MAVSADKLVSSLRGRFDRVLGSLLRPSEPVAIMGFPSHPNPGDSAIWLGQLAAIRRNGNPVVHMAAADTYSRAAVRRGAVGATILISGGGDFGDLYPRTQAFRERVVADFPDHRVIQLPQTIWFSGAGELERCASVLRRHSDLTVLARDTRSLEIAERELGLRALLCPDGAFALDGMPPPRAPDHDVVWLSRSDREAAGPTPEAEAGVAVVDWNRVPDGPAGQYEVARRRVSRAVVWVAGRAGPRTVRPIVWRVWERQARRRVAGAFRLLGDGRVVITDRLHGHILTTLLGIPHVLLDNRYGKLRAFHDTWTRDLDIAHWAESPAEALETAKALAAGGSAATEGGI